MNLFIPLLVKLSESEKRALIILAVVIAFLFVIIGIIGKSIRAWMEHKGKLVDNYMYDLCKYQIIQTPAQFQRYVFARESKTLYLKNRWMMRFFLGAAVAFILYFYLFLEGDFSSPITVIQDLRLVLDWPTSQFFGMQLVSDWPSVVRLPVIHLTVEGYITYISIVIVIWTLITLLYTTLSFMAKLGRSRKISVTAFSKNLDDAGKTFDGGAIS